MRGLFLFALLFLLYCTIGTLAVTEHHRCMHDTVAMKVGADLTLYGFLPSESSKNSFVQKTSPPESGEHKVLHFKSDLDDEWLPILIDISTLDLDEGGRFCTKSGETIVDFFGANIVCDENDVLTPEKRNILVEWILPEAVKLHSERLLVEPMGEPIVVPKFSPTNLCSNFTVPQDHRSKGVPEADMVLYVGAAPTRLGSFAWAATCATLGRHGRPVVGIINYGPRYIAATPQRIRVAAHEIAHALGFSGYEMERKQMVEWDESHLGGLPKVFLSSTNVRRAARKHYGCGNLRRLELYSNDFSSSMRFIKSGLHINTTPVPKALKSSGKIMNRKLNRIDVLTAEDESDNPYAGNVVETFKLIQEEIWHSSHWSRRIAKDELMVGFVGAGYYTALTMGVFADLGYYKVDWTKAEEMSWGNKSGCELLTGKCVENGRTKYPNMFCTSKPVNLLAGLKCTSDRQSLGICNLQNHKNRLPGQFQYFSNDKLGGNRAGQMDYCPIIAGKRETSCTDGVESSLPGSIIATNARCVEGKNLVFENKAVGAVCVEVSCKKKEVRVRYRGDDNWYSCSEGDSLTVQGESFSGEIVCPKYADVCNTLDTTGDRLRGLSTESDGDVATAILAPLLFIFLAVSTIMAP